jgi:uncharacterized protein (TIGR02145 family)
MRTPTFRLLIAFVTLLTFIGCDPELKVVPEVTTSALTLLTTTSAGSGGTVTGEGASSVTAIGLCWSTSPAPTINDSKSSEKAGQATFTTIIEGLTLNTRYYLRAYATNPAGTAYGNEISFTTLNLNEVYNPVTGRVWMDRNLGASRVATSMTDSEATGDLYQWGRAADGHEKRTSGTTKNLSPGDSPGHGLFVTAYLDPVDWRSPQNNNLWQGVNGINNPCPAGYRIPTEAEWNEERATWRTNTAKGAFYSVLKLPLTPQRSYDGAVFDYNVLGEYWTSTVNGINAQLLHTNEANAYTMSMYRIYGHCIRCIKD